MKSTAQRAAALWFGISIFQFAAAADQDVKGKVVDVGSQESKGIAGVEVLLKTASGAQVGTTVTDLNGQYVINLKSQPRLPLIAEFTKINYAENPKIANVKRLDSAQPDVGLVNCDGDDSYYKTAATYIASAPTKELQIDRLNAVAALPAAKNKIVADKLGAYGDANLMGQLASATVTQTMLENFRKGLNEKKIGNVVAGTNQDGKIELFGSVSSSWQMKQLEDVAAHTKEAANIDRATKIFATDKLNVMKAQAGVSQ
jgi:hypothetical protein